jgi:hypothetical protein
MTVRYVEMLQEKLSTYEIKPRDKDHHQRNRDVFGDVTNLVIMKDEKKCLLNSTEIVNENKSLSAAWVYNSFNFCHRSVTHSREGKENFINQTKQKFHERLSSPSSSSSSISPEQSIFSSESHWRPW